MFHWRWALTAFLAFIADQATKIWAVQTLGGPKGEVSMMGGKMIPVIGDNLLRFNLAYNLGSAFSMRPASLVPFLTPTVFYAIITVLAGIGLFYYLMRNLPKADVFSRYGIYLIMAGALGNLADRLRIEKVIDFIDCDFPDIIPGMHRWPVFNLADSWVCIGIALVFFGPWLTQKFRKPTIKV